MSQPTIRSRNVFVQSIFNLISIVRRNVIKEGTVSFWIYDHIFKQAIFEWRRGNRKRAMALFRYRSGALINQGFKVDPYLDWIFTNEILLNDLEIQAKGSGNFANQPLISIVTPVYRPSLQVLTYMLDSVGRQSYPHWEHCIVNGDPTDKGVESRLRAYARKDPRITVKTLEKNLGIAGNTNAAIGMARGEWIAFLDHDDQLAPFALYEVVKRINQDPRVDVLFSDEDKIRTSDQRRLSPFFKPDFNFDYLRSLNYMTHFLVVRKSVGDSVGWCDPGYEGSQDYDLALKLAERTGQITRIPKILYHWKAAEGSAAGSATNKAYAVEAGERALQAHLQRCGAGATVEAGSFPYAPRYRIDGQPKISMIIPNRDNHRTLKRLLDSVFEKSTYPNYEIVIVENHSQEKETFAYYSELEARPNVKILAWQEPFNYSLVNNFAAQRVSGQALLLLNNDLEVISADWLERMLEHALRPEIGAVGAKLYYPNDKIQHAGVIVGMFGAAGHSHKLYERESPGYYNRLVAIQNYSAVTAACLMVRREVYEAAGGMDPDFMIEFGDVDFCLRILRLGYRNLWTPYAQLYHHESLTRGGYDSKEKRELNLHEVALFQTRWADFLKQGDPSYNPNLTHKREDFYFHDFEGWYLSNE
jgi:GT2 family glycosyltransferase